MKIVQVTTGDAKTRYYLSEDDGTPVESVLRHLRFKDNYGRARNTLRMQCIHLKHYFSYLKELGKEYETVSIDDLAGFIAWLKNPDIKKKVIPLRLEPAHKAQPINANVDTVIAYYDRRIQRT